MCYVLLRLEMCKYLLAYFWGSSYRSIYKIFSLFNRSTIIFFYTYNTFFLIVNIKNRISFVIRFDKVFYNYIDKKYEKKKSYYVK